MDRKDKKEKKLRSPESNVSLLDNGVEKEENIDITEKYAELFEDIDVENDYDDIIGYIILITDLSEYKKALHKMEEARQEAEAEKRAAEAQRVESIKAAIPEAPAAVEAPTEQTAAPAPEQKFCIRFTVKGTKEQLIALKKFLNEGEYEYE